METIYFTDGKHSPRQLPQNAEYLDAIIHASFLPKLRSGISREIRRKAKEELLQTRLLERVLLGSLIPSGNPFLADAGHNGYTWEGARREYNLNLEELYSDRFKGKDRELLMSSGFIGSSSQVYMPMIDVVVDKEKKFVREIQLPQFMIYGQDHFREAKYDAREGAFVSLRGAKVIAPHRLKMLSSPTQKSNYLKDNTLTRVPMDSVKMSKYNESCGSVIGGISLIGVAIASLTKVVAFRGMNMSSFEEQIMDYFTLKGQILRHGTRGNNQYGWVTEQQMKNFSYASLGEIEEGVRALQGEKWPHIERKFNKFLLYKAFEKTEGSKGSFIVGGIEGDDHTLHLPYVPVGLRE